MYGDGLLIIRTSLRNWNDGILEYWNVGFVKLGKWGNCMIA
jgi:hypothetical protein